MKLKTTTLAALAALALAGSASAVTTVSYSYYTATSSSDTSWVSPTGSTSVKAVNFGGAQTTFGSVTWLTSNPTGGPLGPGSYNNTPDPDIRLSAPGQAWANSNPGTFYPGGPALLDDGSWTATNQSGGVDFRLEVNGLTVGQAYLVQFVFADDRSGQVGRSIQIDNYSANISASADSSSYQYAYNDGKFAVVTASFTPGAGDMNFEFRPLDSYGGVKLNGIQVLTIPEPGAALLGGLGMFVLLRRRR